jgi:hypothetical protein
MKDFPFDEYRFLVMTVERPKEELIAILEKNGYKKVINIKAGDTLWAHESVYEEGKKYVDASRQDIKDHRVRSPMPGFS